MDNRAQHNWWLTFSSFQKSREKTWAPVLYKNLRAQIQPTINILHEHGLQTAISFLDRSVPMEGLAGTIKNIYIDAGTVFGGKAYQMVKRQAAKLSKEKALVTSDSLLEKAIHAADVQEDYQYGYSLNNPLQQFKRLMPIGFNEALVNDINNYYRLFLLSKAVIPISETTKDFIFKTLTQAQNEGWSIQMIVDKLGDTDITRNRARLIARTETNKASNFAAVWGAKKTNFQTQKIWISARDNRTRRIPRDEFDHLQMNGQTVGLDEAFHVPHKEGGYQELMQPGDANGSAADTIRCRCTVGFKVLQDHAGRPLRI